MLAREFRLSRNDFELVQEKGRVFQFANFGIGVLERGDTDPTKFGFVISTKIAKKAVDRNNIKRILSEAVRFLTSATKGGYSVVFLAKPSIVTRSTDVLTGEVNSALREIGLV